MKISNVYEAATITWFLGKNLNNNEKSNTGLFRKVRNRGEKYPCDRCGYIDCVCTPDRPEYLSQPEN